MIHESTPHRPATCPDCQKQSHRPYTVEDVVKKWAPLTRSKRSPLVSLEGREEEFTAWALEEEARYLNDDEGYLPLFENTLKIVFPLLRRVAPDYASAEMPEFETLIERFKSEATLVVDALIARGIETGRGWAVPSPEAINKLIPPMAERFQGAIKTFKKAVA